MIPLQHILQIWYLLYFTFKIVLSEFITSWQATSFSDSTTAHITNMISCLFHVSDRSSWIHNILTRDFLQWFHFSTYYKYDMLFISLFRSLFLNSLPLDTWLPSAIPFQHILRIWYLVYFTFKIFLSEFVTSWHVTSFSDSISAHITNMIYCLFHVSDRSSWIHNILTSDFLQRFHFSTYYEYHVLFISRLRSFFLNS